MLVWYIFDNLLKTIFPNMEIKQRNLTTLLTGVVLYTLMYSYAKTIEDKNSFLSVFFKYLIYIIISDAFLMFVLYKKFYGIIKIEDITVSEDRVKTPKKTAEIINEIPILRKSKKSKIQKSVDEKPILRKSEKQKINKNSEIPQIENIKEVGDIEDVDIMEGFVKNSALGDVFTTSNI